MDMYERLKYYIGVYNRCVELIRRIYFSECKSKIVMSNLSKLHSIADKYMLKASELLCDISLSEYLEVLCVTYL